ncbi:uncharacterized protein LOC115999435 [Ipomoea triloba]|uniref:uncharacterized protein LOC115999435 n=1 Tax=Ipomoea triloba TaxID=35885 RepID=UPI00125D6AAA|nr:uncharacterized protein LOC115999435 [Ipomoea triloba]
MEEFDFVLKENPPNVPAVFSNRNGIPAVQEAASKPFRATLKQYCRDYSPDLVCLLESKVSGDHANRISTSFGFEEWIRVEAVGFSGGIWVFWNHPLRIQVLNTHPQFVNLQVDEQNSSPWILSLVYGSPNISLCKKLFAELSLSNFDRYPCWLACGDFNSVTSIEEVSNAECFNLSRCSDFKEWIFREGLIDLGFTGSRYTWMRGTNTASFRGARLDRALSTVDWRIRNPNAMVEHLPIINSDHAPLLITCNPSLNTVTRKPFRFNMAWSLHTDFMNCVRSSWDTGKGLEENKIRTAEALQNWNRNTFGDIFQRKKRLLSRIKGVQRSLSSHIRNDLIRLERKLREELQLTLQQEELLWYQRSREEWNTSGDCNSKFYHTATSAKKNRAKITSL